MNKLNWLPIGLFLSIFCLTPAWAGPNTSGGGNSVNNRMVDLTTVQPEDLAGFDNMITPAIERAKRLIPEFGQNMEDTIHQLSFKIVPRRLPKVPSSETGIPFETDQVGIQRKGGEVWIDETYYAGLVDEKNKAGLIIHETVLALLGKAHPEPADYSAVRNITSFLMQSREPSSAALNRIDEQLSGRGFGIFTTALDLQRKEAAIKKYAERFAKACEEDEVTAFPAKEINFQFEILTDLASFRRYQFSQDWQEIIKKQPGYLAAADLVKNGKLVWSCERLENKSAPSQAVSEASRKQVLDSPDFRSSEATQYSDSVAKAAM